MKISELMDGIRKQDIVLPEFQREYVWNRDQAKKLIASLLKEYPVGALLFWKTDNPPELKNLSFSREMIGTTQVILDDRDVDIKTDPRDLYFNINSCELQYYTQSIMKNDPLWVRVVDCFTSKKNIEFGKIAKAITPEDDIDAVLEKVDLFQKNVFELTNIPKINLPEQVVPSTATLTDAIDIFDLVNSQGTKLSDAELALTHITGKWAKARKVIKKKIDELQEHNFYFDLTFMTRAMTVVVARRALYETVHDQPKEKLQAGWKKLSAILDYLVSILPEKAYIHSTSDMSTTNVLIPIIAYLSINNGRFPDEKNLKRALYFIYTSLTWARYSGQTNQRLEYDVSIIMRENNPWDKLTKALIDQRDRLSVKPSDLEGRTASHPLYLMSFIVAKSQGAVDWFNGLPITAKMSKKYYMQSHHIFPSSLLYKNGYNSENHLHKKIVNEIANRAFLTADSNISLSDTDPSEYLASIEDNFPGALTKQFIPIKPELWKIERYVDFLEARRQLIAMKINEYFMSLITEPIDVKEKPLEEIISLGESASLEFKSTLQWDMVQNAKNKQLRKSVLKTISAFLNSDGGTLVIGVEDNGNICGLDFDLGLVGNSEDKFLVLLNTLIDDTIGAEYSALIKTRVEKAENRKVCIIDIDRSMSPVFLNLNGTADFFVRSNNTTRSLDTEASLKYIDQHWS